MQAPVANRLARWIPGRYLRPKPSVSPLFLPSCYPGSRLRSPQLRADPPGNCEYLKNPLTGCGVHLGPFIRAFRSTPLTCCGFQGQTPILTTPCRADIRRVGSPWSGSEGLSSAAKFLVVTRKKNPGARPVLLLRLGQFAPQTGRAILSW